MQIKEKIQMIEETVDTVETNDFFDTPQLEVAATEPEAHRAVITAVTLNKISSREDWPVIEINLTSRDVPTLEQRYSIFLPKAFDDTAVAAGRKFDPKSLPEDANGDFWSKQQTMFTRNVANSDSTAALQKLVFNTDSVARHAGKDPVQEGLVRPTTVEEYASNISKMLTGVECIMLLRERGGDDPAFKHQLQVKDILSADEAENNPKRLKKYTLKWEN
jgi:hypothetical protein